MTLHEWQLHRPAHTMRSTQIVEDQLAVNTYIECLFFHLLHNGYIPSDSESCIFTNKSSNDFIAITVTVGDFILTASNPQMIDSFFNTLSTKYTVERMGNPSDYLG